MRIARIGKKARERPVAINAASRPRALSPYLRDFTPEMLPLVQLAWLCVVDTEKLAIIQGSMRYAAPVFGTRKFVVIGLNYSDHAAEAGMPIPGEPVVFMKAVTSSTGPNGNAPISEGRVDRLGGRVRDRNRKHRPPRRTRERHGPGGGLCPGQ